MSTLPHEHIDRGRAYFCECGDHAFSPIGRGLVAMVSPQDAGLLSKRWFASGMYRNTMVVRGEGTRADRRRVLLSRVIVQPDAAFQVDHINCDGTDNRRQNLRQCSPAENARNRRKERGSANPSKGVFQYPSGRFNAKIMVDGKRFNLGTYDTLPEAEQAYAQAALRLHGDFARVE